ncbi:hypothetical protein F4809DRAFT_632776 [Biscogniauxia mediterranea]|nr:hypothetical protein F4809DRAFT_632776 [Biscogniauxia mediterranea]
MYVCMYVSSVVIVVVVVVVVGEKTHVARLPSPFYFPWLVWFFLPSASSLLPLPHGPFPSFGDVSPSIPASLCSGGRMEPVDCLVAHCLA